MPICKEYLNHTLGLTLSTPGLVNSFYSDLGNMPCYSRRVVDHGCGLFEQMLCCSLPSVSLSISLSLVMCHQAGPVSVWPVNMTSLGEAMLEC